MTAWIKVRRYFFRFIAWSLLFALVYFLVFDYYESLVVRVAEVFTDIAVPVTIQPHPKGLVITSPKARQPMGAPYSLYLIGLNVIFAPALVMTTVGLTLGGALRSVTAVSIMLILHAINVMLVVLFYVSHPDNPSIVLGFSEPTVATIGWIYRFFDRMGYALFPFLAWAIVCPDVIARLVSTRDRSIT
jgi:hypothetical protein